MRVAIDLRPLQIGHQNRGIGAYLLNLLERLPSENNVSYIFLRYGTSDPLKDFDLHIQAPYKEVVMRKRAFSKHPIKLLQYGANGLLPSYGALKKHRPNVFFQADYLLGAPHIFGCKLVTVSHDLIPLKFRQMYLPHWTKFIGFHQFKVKARVRLVLRAWFYEMKYRRGISLLRRSNSVVSVSESTKKDLVELLGIHEDHIQVIHSAASFRDESSNDTEVRAEIKHAIDSIDDPFLTYIGGTDRRRQVDELVHAFNLYNARDGRISLVLCGNEFEAGSTEINPKVKEAIENSSYSMNIHALGKVTEAEKQYVLEKTTAFVYPTLYEGFGLPLLEAMACGAPILSYKNSSIPEIAGNLPIYTDGVGGFLIYLALRKLLSAQKSDLEKTRNQSIKKAADFNWKTCAERTWSLVTSQ